MCSDGLSDMLDDDAIANILASDAPLEQKSVQLVDAANANGGRDNISVLLAQANSGSKKRGLISRWLGQ
jgi:protein phosphatase